MRTTILLIFTSINLFFLSQLHAYKGYQHGQQSGSSNPKNINHNFRSDSVDVLHYNVNLDVKNFSAQSISGFTEVKINPKMNGITTLNLDFLQMIIDSISKNGIALTYNYNDTLLKINLGASYNTSDTVTIKVSYHGMPQGDPSGFGGFDFNGVYAYNLGVGFDADPHTYGRVWHPCFDNFVERATYSFQINTDSLYRATCNGALVNTVVNSDGSNSWFWNMNENIPTYLACIAVSKYAIVHQNFTSLSGNIPVELAALPADTTNMKNAFIHLENAFDIFENHFGPYRWNKVGYTLVPFNGGAMEHATNIGYPQIVVALGTTYEAELMSHELAHHWFGDLVTCHEAEDMWLNEGLASFAAYVFTENLYGYDAYKKAIRTNHAKLLQFTHLKEGGYRAVSGVPHEYTYGDHVYLKGADMAHTIRGYMGDAKFFQGIKDYMNNHAFSDVTSYTLRDELAASSGLNLTDCFDNLVFSSGWAHFSVDSFNVQSVGGAFQVQVFVKQKLTGAPNFFNNVPVELTFKNNLFASVTETITASGQNSNATFTLPFNPTYVGINLESKISDATVSEYKTIKTTGASNFTDSKFNFNCSAITDSAFVRIEHNFTAPDEINPNAGYILSPNRYYKVDGIFPPSFKASASFPYDGRTAGYSSNYYLDNLLFTAGYNEDSLILMYRAHAGEQWQPFPYASRAVGSTIDKYGTMKIDSLKKGEYVLAMKNNPSAIKQLTSKLMIFAKPNPANDVVEINFSSFNFNAPQIVTITDNNGQLVEKTVVYPSQQKLNINTIEYANGIYHISLGDKMDSHTQKLIIAH